MRKLYGCDDATLSACVGGPRLSVLIAELVARDRAFSFVSHGRATFLFLLPAAFSARMGGCWRESCWLVDGAELILRESFVRYLVVVLGRRFRKMISLGLLVEATSKFKGKHGMPGNIPGMQRLAVRFLNRLNPCLLLGYRVSLGVYTFRTASIEKGIFSFKDKMSSQVNYLNFVLVSHGSSDT